ncbi:MAG: hypothetical protein CM15mP3_02970 [Candidatus Poseidoniales archaeon]|nr:MAG: hypothetical protein CM15mP3_02970 [Candidatus Poseidoniales archaeon]
MQYRRTKNMLLTAAAASGYTFHSPVHFAIFTERAFRANCAMALHALIWQCLCSDRQVELTGTDGSSAQSIEDLESAMRHRMLLCYTRVMMLAPGF